MAQTALNIASPDFYADAPAVARIIEPEEAVFCFSTDALKTRLSQFLSGFPGKVSFAV